jgi:NADH-quinone oxidoreductase subunit M
MPIPPNFNKMPAKIIAHVEAPVYGSMILAGILLKLGGIGMLRFFSYLRSLRLNNFLALVRLFGMLLVGRGCLFIPVLQKIIAFSSIAHIGLAISLLVFKFHLGV